MMFNVLAHNRDDHPKQFSFLMDREGRWRLSPAYDLTFSYGPGGEHSMDIAGEGRCVEREHLLSAAQGAGLSRRKARVILAEVLEGVATWPDRARTFGAFPETIHKIEASLQGIRSDMT